MGNNKNESNKSLLDDLKKEFQTMSDDQLNTYTGGTKKSSNKWNLSLGGVTPQ